MLLRQNGILLADWQLLLAWIYMAAESLSHCTGQQVHTLRTCLTSSSLSASASSSSLGVSSERVLRLAVAGERGRGDEVPLPLFLDWEEIGLNSQRFYEKEATCMGTLPPLPSPR